MLYLISQLFKGSDITRLLQSHIILMGIGLFLAFLLTVILLPHLWHILPKDHGKALAINSMGSKGKPTGAGLIILWITLPIIILVFPFTLQSWYIWAFIGCIFIAMYSGYFDDRSEKPWSENKKLILDIIISLLVAWIICCRPSVDIVTGKWQYFIIPQPTTIWFPFIKQFSNFFIQIPGIDSGIGNTLLISPSLYFILATGILIVSINATNCSDGVDNLAGMLALLSLLFLAFFLYVVVGHTEYASYLNIPHHAGAPRWALVLFCFIGSLCGYIWHNAFPSAVMMGDAGSRALGLLIGISVLLTGNPLMIFAVAPMILINGATGLAKLLILRSFKILGYNILSPDAIKQRQEKDSNYIPPKQNQIIKILHMIRFPLHDHFKKSGWSPAQIMIRFLIIQALMIPILITILVKLR